MKTYEKPMIMIMPLEGNEQLCGSCADKGAFTLNPNGSNPNPNLNSMMLEFADVDQNGTVDRDEASNCFGSNESCTLEFDMYCKFTSSGQKVAWS